MADENNLMNELSGLTPYIGTLGTTLIGSAITVLGIYRNRIFDLMMRMAENKHHLKHHDLFDTIMTSKQNLKYIQFPDHVSKTRMLKEFLNIKLTVIYDETQAFMSDKEKLKLKGSALEFEARKLFRGIIDKHDKKWEDMFRAKNVPQDKVDYVINTFNKWHKPTIMAIEEESESIFRSGHYKTSYQKLNALMSIFSMGVRMVLSEGVTSFKEMNGQLDDVEF